MWWLKWGLNANLCEQRRIWRVCKFAQAYLSLSHCTKSLVLPKMAICVLLTPAANTLVSLHICAGQVTGQCDKYQYLLCWQRRLLGVCTFAQARLSLRHCTKSLVLPKMAICVLLTPAANTLVSLHICAGQVTGQCDKYQYLLCWQRRLLGVCTFAQARLSLRHNIKICAG